LLQEFNSRSYLKLISNFGDEVLPPLLRTIVHDLEIEAKIPMLAESLEKTLHELDENTPPDLIYEDLIARNVKLIFTGLSFKLRDYTNPLMYMPQSAGSYFVMEGLVVIADPESPPQCKRVVALPLDFDDELSLLITRNANSTKTYMRTNMRIHTDSVVRICLGAPFEPCLADVITVLDSFSKATEDPSPPIGWWDKLRVIFHGTNSLKLSGSGRINVLILGSASPYFDPRKHYGIEGLEWIFGNGLDIVFGPKSENNTKLDMVVECGELKLNMPRSFKHSSDAPEVCFAKLTGGVKMVLSCDFMTTSPDRVGASIRPWRKHHELTLLPGESRRNSIVVNPGQSYDSYYGFRSKSIQVYLDICSPHGNYSSLAVPQNCLFLNSETMAGVAKLSTIYQSLLTNVPVKRGNLFNSVAVAVKPKLGREVNSVFVKTIFRPLMLSFILDCEDGDQSAGIRLRCQEMDWTAQFRQYDVKLVSQAVLDKKPVTKWIRESSFISFIEVEGRVVSYAYPDSDLAIPTAKNVMERDADLNGWIFSEDNAVFKDISNLCLLPCVWAPKLDFLALENGKQTQETEDSASKGTF
jgi:RNA pol II promoter Fmp27 protein domain